MGIKHTYAMQSLVSNGSWKRLHNEVQKLIEDGTLKPENQYNIYITDKKPVRTGNQNRYYWGVVVASLVEMSGMDAEAIHDIWKRMFAGYTMQMFGGKRRKVLNSTSSMSKEKMAEYIEKCIAFCAEHGVVVPSPEAIPDAAHVEMVCTGALKA